MLDFYTPIGPLLVIGVIVFVIFAVAIRVDQRRSKKQ